MKKWLSALLVICLCCSMLIGCGEKIITEDFDSASNQKATISVCNFEVPQNWKKGDNSTGEMLYYYPEEGMLMVGYSEMNQSILDEQVRKDFIEGFGAEFDEFELKGETECEIDGSKAYRHEMSIKMSDNKYNTSMVTLDCSKGVVSFMMATLKSSDKDYSQDFTDVISSIKVMLPFERKISEADDVFSILGYAGKNNFSSFGIDTLDDGTTMETLIDTDNGLLITILGDADENITVVHASAKDEEGIASVSVMALMGVDILSSSASEFLTNLSTDNLVSMSTEAEDAKIEVIDGVSYMIMKSDSSEYQYTFSLQRDNETKEDYETYLQYRELMEK